MIISEDIRPISYLKSRAADMLHQVNTTHRPVIITQNGEPRAVLQDTESYERTQTAIRLMKLIVQSEEDVRQGKMLDHKEVISSLRRKIHG